MDYSNGSEGSKAIGTTATMLMQANDARVALTISGPKTARVTVSGNTGVTAGVGISLHPGIAPVMLNCNNVGNWITKELWAIAEAGTETIGWVEVLCPQDNNQ